MKSKVLNRPMFMDVENVGIMQGFKDVDEGMDDGYETSTMIARTPDSPEILMNNLRGDMRSIDARVQELADMVGEDIAMETPQEVLALLQPVLAAQEGIGSLPAGMPPQPMGAPSPTPPSPMGAAMPASDMGMPPEMMDPSMGMPPEMGMMPPEMGMMPPGAGMMPQGPMPTDQVPLQMAQGGYVQRFRDGSDEEGVTPDDDQGPPMPRDPAVARAMLEQLRAQQRSALPSLEDEVGEILPTYQRILGTGDKSMTQAQMLFDIAQAGLNLASGTDAQGRTVRGSFASRLAAASQQLPERVAARAGQMRQEEQGVKLAALKAAESSVEAQRKMFGDMMKGESLFGKGAWEWNIINKPGLMDRWSRGEVTTEEETQVQSAIAKLSQPRTELRSDPVTGQMVPVQVPPIIPPFVSQAVQQRGGSAFRPVPSSVSPPGATTPTSGGSVLSADGSYVPESLAATVDDVASAGTPDSISPAPGRIGPVAAPGTTLDMYDPTENTFFNLAGKGTGPVNVTKRTLNKLPIIGSFIDADQETNAAQFMNAGVNAVARALGETERFGSIEKAQILEQLGLLPSFIDRPDALRMRIVGLDNLLLKAMMEMDESAYDPNLPVATRKETLGKLNQIRQVRSLLGAPPRVYNMDDLRAIGVGQPFVFDNKIRYKTQETQ